MYMVCVWRASMYLWRDVCGASIYVVNMCVMCAFVWFEYMYCVCKVSMCALYVR